VKRLLAVSLALALALAACAKKPAPEKSLDAAHYLDAIVDTTADPRVDFNKFAVGQWLKNNPIPANERSWGIGHVVQEEIYRRQIEINEEAQAKPGTAGSNSQKIGDFWAAAMDSDAVAKQGYDALKDEFARIDAVADRDGFLAEVARLKHMAIPALLSLPIGQDERNSAKFTLHLYQGGIGLPNRSYYVDTDEKAAGLRREYVNHVATMFHLLGDDTTKARARADAVMAIETELARASRTLEALRDPIANYHPMTLDGAAKLTPAIRWKQFLEGASIANVDTVVVGQPEFFQQLEKTIAAHSIDDWKSYLRWHLANAYADKAGGEFEKADFHFFGTVLNGVPEQRPRWKRMLDEEENYLGDALGQLYVAKYFSPHTKARYEGLVTDVFAAFADRIRNEAWMTPQTKERALQKLGAVIRKVGYPDKWRDYSAYKVERTSFLGNVVRGNIWLRDYDIAKLHKPVDRTEWEMTPQTYNAYYNPSNNEIVLPAAAFILPGIADSLIDDALVYGYAGGGTIGHEITHGLDDEGRQFDDKGNLVDWWTPQDAKEFKARASRIVDQFNGYVATGDLHVNGAATAGENIADLGGMVIAWDAFTKTEQYKKGEKLGGLTPQQRFFIGWALGWMNNLRPENIAMRVRSDVHSPSFWRTNGPVSNLPQFYEAYGVKAGDPMWRSDSVRVSIW